jgi:hypothetical protein
LAFLTPFSGALASADDQVRFTRAARGLFIAGMLAGVCGGIGIVWVPEKEVLSAFPTFWRFKLLALGELLLWLSACWYPGRIRRQFRYIEGASATILAFAVISHFAFVLVLWTGGLNASVFSATFLSLFGVAVLVPEDAAIRIVLVLVVLVESIILTAVNVPYRQHNSAMLTLSLIAYVFAAVIRFLLERDNI